GGVSRSGGPVHLPPGPAGLRLRRQGNFFAAHAQGDHGLGGRGAAKPPSPQRAPARGGEIPMSPGPSKRRPPLGAVLAQLLPAVSLSLLCAGVGVIHVPSRLLVVHAGYRLSGLENDGRSLVLENDRLKLELATLRSPARLEPISREKLGLIPPPAGSVIDVSAPKSAPRPTTSVGAGDHPSPRRERMDAKPTPVRVVDRGLQ